MTDIFLLNHVCISQAESCNGISYCFTLAWKRRRWCYRSVLRAIRPLFLCLGRGTQVVTVDQMPGYQLSPVTFCIWTCPTIARLLQNHLVHIN